MPKIFLNSAIVLLYDSIVTHRISPSLPLEVDRGEGKKFKRWPYSVYRYTSDAED